MATNERVVTRREPIPVRIAATKQVFKAAPLFWRSRLDFGQLIVAEYTRKQAAALPEVIRHEGAASELVFHFDGIDYGRLLEAGYPDVPLADYEKLDVWEIVELVKTAMEINGLKDLWYMVDPSLKDPVDEMMERALTDAAGQKMLSSIAASSSESTPTPASAEMAPLG